MTTRNECLLIESNSKEPACCIMYSDRSGPHELHLTGARAQAVIAQWRVADDGEDGRTILRAAVAEWRK